MDYRVCSESGLMPALFANPALFILVQVVAITATLLSYNSHVLTSLSKVILAVLFTLKLLAELSYLHRFTVLVYDKGRVGLYHNLLQAQIVRGFWGYSLNVLNYNNQIKAVKQAFDQLDLDEAAA